MEESEKPTAAQLSDASSEEKQVGGQTGYITDLPPDPDAHLSPEERAAIVYSLLRVTFRVNTDQISGPQIAVEIRFDVDPMGMRTLTGLWPH